MTYLPHWKVSLIGGMGADPLIKETWNCSLRFDGVDSQVNDQTAMDGAASNALATASAWITDTTAKFSAGTELHEVRIYKIGSDGLSTGLIGYSTGDAVRGTATSGHQPYQISNVISLVADGRPPGVRGRIYQPPQSFGVNYNSEITAGNADAMLAAFNTMAHDLELDLASLTADTPQLVIASGVGSGSLKVVTQTRCGLVPDTHRSRRRSLAEQYEVTTYS